MKTSKILAAAALAVLASMGAAHAEQYEGVHALTSQRARADVAAEATVAARSASPYAEGANAGVPVAIASTADRGAVVADAVAKSHDPSRNLQREAFYNSTIPAGYGLNRHVTFTRQAAL